MQVWRAHSEKDEIVYWFFHLKNGCWYRFDQQFGTWLEIASAKSLPNRAIAAIVHQRFQLARISRKNLTIEWQRMFQKYNPPFITSEIAP